VSIKYQSYDPGRHASGQGPLVISLMVVAAISIGACAPREPTYTGGQNVDPAKYNSDLAACKKQAASSFSAGNAVTDCMRARGYSVS